MLCTREVVSNLLSVFPAQHRVDFWMCGLGQVWLRESRLVGHFYNILNM
jgi:hypothetical protein